MGILHILSRSKSIQRCIQLRLHFYHICCNNHRNCIHYKFMESLCMLLLFLGYLHLQYVFFLPLQHFLTETLRVCQSDDNYFIPVSLGSISLQATSAKYFCGSTQTYIPTLFACFIAAPSCNCQFFGAEDVEESNLVFSAIYLQEEQYAQ